MEKERSSGEYKRNIKGLNQNGPPRKPLGPLGGPEVHSQIAVHAKTGTEKVGKGPRCKPHAQRREESEVLNGLKAKVKQSSHLRPEKKYRKKLHEAGEKGGNVSRKGKKDTMNTKGERQEGREQLKSLGWKRKKRESTTANCHNVGHRKGEIR